MDSKETKQTDLFKRGWAMQTKLHAEWNVAVQKALAVVRRLEVGARQTFLIDAKFGSADTLEPWGMVADPAEQNLVASFSTSFVLREDSSLMRDVKGSSDVLNVARQLFWLHVHAELSREGALDSPPLVTDRALHAVRQIEELLYPNGDFDHQWGVDDLDEIARLLTANGFGTATKGG